MANKDEVQTEGFKVSEAMPLTELSEPKRYRIYLLNDDYTPMDFVVQVLQKFFYLSEDSATQIMLEVHQKGRGLCGVFPRDIAETKVVLVNEFSRLNQFPLLCSMEQE